MEFKNLKYYLLIVVLISNLSACTSDYLDTQIEEGTSDKELYSTTNNIKIAINGISKLMVSQYTSDGHNGEGTIKLLYGEYLGSNFRVAQTNQSARINGKLIESIDGSFTTFPWHYYFMIIRNANAIIEKIDIAKGPDSDKQYLKAQALSYRAYAYMMLVQLYGERWQDSKEGTTVAVPLRLSIDSPSTMLLATSKEIYTQIYKDLDEAILLFSKSNFVRPVNKFYYINQDVTHAIYARAALIKGDYEIALKNAALAKANYPLMTKDQYISGFSTSNSEWIWGSYGSEQEQLHFYSYHAQIGYNSTAVEVRSFPKRISKELYSQIPKTDIRKKMFIDGSKYRSKTYNGETGVASKNSDLDKDTRKKFPELQSNALVAAYMQFKFKANDMPGVGDINHFRSSEMYLIEAEALYKLGREKEASNILTELNILSKRDTKYICNKTGQDLFDEIVKYRGIELWGEGFDWFDRKRWKMPIIRKSVAEGGNANLETQGQISPSDNNNWKLAVPSKETNFK